MPLATITPPLDNKVRRSSICRAIRQLRSFSRAFRCSRFEGSVEVICFVPRLAADVTGLGAPGFCPAALKALIANVDVAGVDVDEWWGVRVPLDDVTTGMALALSVPDDPVNDETGC